MRIVSLTSENIKRLSAVNITPAGNIVELTGKNGAGKTSVTDSIWLALDYGEAHKKIPEPLRKGAKEGRIKLDLGEVIVTRTFARKEDGETTTALALTSAEGARFPSPQAMIDGFLGAMTFDPEEFSRLKPAEQFEMLKVFVPDFDFKALADAQKADFERRTELNRGAKLQRAAAEAIPEVEDLPEEPPNVDQLTLQLAGAADHNAEIDRRIAKRAQVAADADRMRDQANELLERAQTLRAQADQVEQEGQQLLDKSDAERRRVLQAPALPAKIDTKALAEAIDLARSVERQLQDQATRNKHLDHALHLEQEASNLTAIMEAREGGKQRAIAAAKLPVPGLGFGDGIVLLDGVPFEQGSEAQRLTASAAIGMAMNPKLRVLRIRQGSGIDADGMQLLETLAGENDYQIWVERVDSSGRVGFVIEDGHLKGAAAAAAAPTAAAPKANGTPAPRQTRRAGAAAASAPAVPEPVEGNLLQESDL